MSLDTVTCANRKPRDSDLEEVQLYTTTVLDRELPLEYSKYRVVFSEEKARWLLEHGLTDHVIKTIAMPPYRPIYNLSVDELAELCRYLAKHLEKGWIRPSTSPVGAPILFVPKKDSNLQLYVNY